ncbi:hypothetical protein [Burkholderia cenocepacia]|uniref:hypothetical protein n=1 Tax=Burkholderia cenocepacia TaxID=95486 RepID=UPI00286183F0|nr:hypothetical protein [Burkholderia cenocepacia]MDR8032280.1 hypothetical protein [Burkholderia cenocepacia]
MPIKLTHETAPYIARSIVESGSFIAGPILGDAGMNAYIDSGFYNRDQAERTGAFVEFEWTGPVAAAPARGVHEPDVLYDEQPHRAFIFVCTCKYLRVTGVRFRPGLSWRDAVHVPSRPTSAATLSPAAWLAWARTWQTGWLDRQAAELESTVLARLATKPSVSIVPPANCPYLFIPRDRGLI